MAKNHGRILIVDDNSGVRRTLQVILSPHFESVNAISSPIGIRDAIEEFKPDAVLLDMNFKSTINSGNEGLFYLKEIKSVHPHIQVVLFTAYGDIPLAVEGMKQGAFDFIEKPWDNDNLIDTLKKAYLKGKGRKNDQSPQEPVYWDNSPKTAEIRELVNRIAPTGVTVLITGENGVGKEVVAREIYTRSDRKDKPYVAVDMGAVTETLFESELFGHVKGAFTGAVSDHQGKFEQANGGTIFLDEIGNLSLTLQAKLLRALQNRVITRVGGNKEIPVNIRIISATNKNLKKEVLEGRFREDLYYRLAGFEIEIAPLRERKDDIIGMSHFFLSLFSKKYGKEGTEFDEGAKQYLLNHTWPGNIRELKQRIERALIFSDNGILTADNLTAGGSQSVNIDKSKNEKEIISEALAKTGRNISKTAKLLNMSRPTLYSKLNKYNL